MKKSILALPFLLSLVACVAPTKNAPFAFGKTTETTFDNQAHSLTAVEGSKTGKACVKSILFFASGDNSVETAKKKGHITQISTISREINNFIIGSEVCTVVVGK